MKRAATDAELKSAPHLEVRIPPSKFASDPISRGAVPELYSATSLKKVAIEKHARTDEFEKRLMGLWWTLEEQPVPFVFRTSDGSIRSLDAGCVGFLLNRWHPEVEAIEQDGVIVAVRPQGALLSRYEPIRDRLVAALKLGSGDAD